MAMSAMLKALRSRARKRLPNLPSDPRFPRPDYSDMGPIAAGRRADRVDRVRQLVPESLLAPSSHTLSAISPNRPTRELATEMHEGLIAHTGSLFDKIESGNFAATSPIERLRMYYGSGTMEELERALRAGRRRSSGTILDLFPTISPRRMFAKYPMGKASGLPRSMQGYYMPVTPNSPEFGGIIFNADKINRTIYPKRQWNRASPQGRIIAPRQASYGGLDNTLTLDHELTHGFTSDYTQDLDRYAKLKLGKFFDLEPELHEDIAYEYLSRGINPSAEMVNKAFRNRLRYDNYSLTPQELDPRLAEIKRLYTMFGDNRKVHTLSDASKALTWGNKTNLGHMGNLGLRDLARIPHARELMKHRMLELLGIGAMAPLGVAALSQGSES